MIDPDMTVEPDRAAARRLTGLAHQVGRVSGREPVREFMQWISRGRLGRRTGWPDVCSPTDTVAGHDLG